ncbi:MAG: acyltransferase [Alistipes sp.]|nr:acyltransferase [Alistipes sp.]
MNADPKPLTIDLEQVIRKKNATLARLLPRFILEYLKRTIHQTEINRVLATYGHLEPIPFLRATLADMGISYHSEGLDTLPEGRYLFASNHPFGGMDGIMLCDELGRRFGSARIIVNDLLMNLAPLRPLFVPVNKHGRQNSAYAQLFHQTLQGDLPVATFPAGLCSRRHHGIVSDTTWKPSFVKHAIESHRAIVPVLFEGQLSSFFYNLSSLRTHLGIKANLEMLYLPDEMFAQRGKHFRIRFGTPIPWQTLSETESPKVWAMRIRQCVYRLKNEEM